MQPKRFLALSALAALAAAGSANAGTIATFSDPAAGPGTPLFSYSGGLLTGGWSAPGLTLHTPGLGGIDYTNATFTMSPLATIVNLGPVQIMTGGVVNFFDSANNPLLTITFSTALLSGPVSLGASDFVGNNVTFSGPILGATTYQNEAFAFSFANPIGNADSFSVTAAFTSSADPVLPTPGAAALLGMGGMMAARRRRN